MSFRGLLQHKQNTFRELRHAGAVHILHFICPILYKTTLFFWFMRRFHVFMRPNEQCSKQVHLFCQSFRRLSRYEGSYAEHFLYILIHCRNPFRNALEAHLLQSFLGSLRALEFTSEVLRRCSGLMCFDLSMLEASWQKLPGMPSNERSICNLSATLEKKMGSLKL